MKKFFGIALFSLFVWQSLPVSAMQHIPVELNFSTQAERDKWKLRNTVDTVPTTWIIKNDPDYAYGDDYMLCLTSDGGKTRNYVPSDGKNNYRCIATYQLDTLPAGAYVLTYRYRGMSPDIDAYVYVNATTYTEFYGSSYTFLNEQGQWWHEGSMNITSDGKTPCTVTCGFYNRSSKEPSMANQGYAIDAIQIYPSRTDPHCSQIPLSFTLSRSGNDVKMSWHGNAAEYQLEYFMNDSSDHRHHRIENITARSYTLHSEEIPEGTYTFRVRAICGNDTSGWATHDYQLVYDISQHCMDYLNYNHPNGYVQYTNELACYQFLSSNSKQVVHHYPRDYDARTKYQLRTFPEGQPASIRLGNWLSGAETDRITYTMQITEDMPVLQMRYALVMQLPGHKPEQQPRFTLEFLDSVGVLIDSCAFVDFTASANMEGWNTIHEEGKDDIIWKDWTLIGLNMRQYLGRTIQIRLTAKDCTEGKHFGYAYFTLACPHKLMQGIHCGVKPDSFVVEEGFYYRWYKKYETPQVILGTDRTFHLTDPQDTATYCVDLINMLDTSCYFSMDASSLAFIPKADGVVKYVPLDCKNYIQFVDKSQTLGVYWKKDGTKVIVNSKDGAEDRVWDLGAYGTFSDRTFKIGVPDTGDTIHVKLHAYMENRLCEDVYSFDYVVPPIGTVHTVNTHYFCKGGSAIFNGKTYSEEIDFTDTVTSWTGCDSISTMALRYFRMDTIEEYDTLCTGGAPLQWYGQTLSTSGDYFTVVPSKVYDCDSVNNILHLFMQPKMNMSVNYTQQAVCARNGSIEVPFSLVSGTPRTYDLLFSDDARKHGFTNRYGQRTRMDENRAVIDLNDDVWAGIYDASIVFHNIHCDTMVFPLTFSVYYDPEDLITQRWNDFLSVRQTAYDEFGGFVDYQWYKDGEPLRGETGSQLYLPDEGLDQGSGYSVELTRVEDGVRVRSCPFYPTVEPNTVTLAVFPTVMSAQRRTPLIVSISQPAQITLYYQSGMQVAAWHVTEGEHQLRIPQERGLYLLHVITEKGERKTKKIIVQ